MSEHPNDLTIKPKYLLIGIFFAAILGFSFAAIGSPGLMGVGAAIGMSAGMLLGQHSKKEQE